MDTIRPLHHADIPFVAALFQKIFRRSDTPAPDSLGAYFEEIYLNNPWRDKKFSSLIYEHDGSVAGFLGAIPFPMKLNGKNIMAVIGGNYMIDPEHPNPLAGVKILKTLFAGPQNLTYSDTATDTARKIWEGLGSETLYLYSLQWLKVIKPVQFAAVMGTRNTLLSPIAQAFKPFSYLIDRSLQSIPRSPFHIQPAMLQNEEFSTSGLLQALNSFTARTAMVPDYSDHTLEWLIRKAEEKTEFGRLKKVALYNTEKKLQGWFLYYPNKGKLGQVLQLGAARQTMNAVLNHLFLDAKNEGSLALAGRVEPKFIPEFTSHNCIITHRNSSLVVYSADAEILSALHKGDAFFSRLEGEWWTRLQGDSFNSY
jgi:hypothetical protein